eukprot:223342_1
MVTNFFTFSAFIIVAKAANFDWTAANFDWTAAKTELESKRALWLNTGITSYVYHWEGDYHLEDDPCFIGEKYIEISGESVTDVRFNPEWLPYDPYNEAPCISPLSTSKDITFYYDKAIEHAQRGIDANCPNMTAFKIGIDPTPNSICGGSVSFQYEKMLYYPTSISLRYGNFVSSDIGKWWTFSCLTPISDQISIDLSLYTNKCVGDCSICTGYTTNVDPYCCEGQVWRNPCIAACVWYGCIEGGYKTFPDGLNGTEISCEFQGCSSCDGYSHSDCIALSGRKSRKYEDIYECPCTDTDSLEFITRYKFVTALDEDIMFCNICFCDDENTETCVEKIDGLPQRKKLMDRFIWKCDLECDFDFVGLKDGQSDLPESDVCDCTLFECKHERVRTVYNESGYDGILNLTGDSNSDANRIGVFIGSEFVVAVFWWLMYKLLSIIF